MRSGVGTFCPRSRRLDFFEVLFPCAEALALEEVVFFGVALCACPEPANTPSPATRSSIGARQVAFRSRIVNSVRFGSVVAATIADYRPELGWKDRCSESV